MNCASCASILHKPKISVRCDEFICHTLFTPFSLHLERARRMWEPALSPDDIIKNLRDEVAKLKAENLMLRQQIETGNMQSVRTFESASPKIISPVTSQDWRPRFSTSEVNSRFSVENSLAGTGAQTISLLFTSPVHRSLRSANAMTTGQYEWSVYICRTLCQRIMLGVCTAAVPVSAAHESPHAWVIHCDSGFRWHHNERSACTSRILSKDKVSFLMDADLHVLYVSWNGGPYVVAHENVTSPDGELFVFISMCERFDTIRISST